MLFKSVTINFKAFHSLAFLLPLNGPHTYIDTFSYTHIYTHIHTTTHMHTNKEAYTFTHMHYHRSFLSPTHTHTHIHTQTLHHYFTCIPYTVFIPLQVQTNFLVWKIPPTFLPGVHSSFRIHLKSGIQSEILFPQEAVFPQHS